MHLSTPFSLRQVSTLSDNSRAKISSFYSNYRMGRSAAYTFNTPTREPYCQIPTGTSVAAG